MVDNLYSIADELRAVANQGLYFAENDYDKERYRRILNACARLVSIPERRPPAEILTEFQGDLFHFSPLSGADAVVLRDGKVLLIQRSDSGLWALPGGGVEIGETVAHAAERELWEEAGLHGKAARLLGIFDSRLWNSRAKFHLNHFAFLIETGTDLPVPGYPEALAADFFSEGELPPFSPGHDQIVPFVLRSLLEVENPTYFDSE